MNGKLRYFFINILLFSIEVSGIREKDDLELKYVNVIFRHGDRTPDSVETYPNDLNKEFQFDLMGHGMLTNRGKLHEYELGMLLRNKYNDFLGDLYFQEDVYAQSTDYSRTKMSLQLVLASLYPPSGSQKWLNELNWQPIPTIYVIFEDDWLMSPEYCPEYLRLRKIVDKSPKVVDKVKKFDELMNNLTDWTGKPISNTYDMYLLYHLLVSESSLNLTIPNWAQDIFPYGKLFNAIKLEYELFSYTTHMRRLNGGKLLYKIVEDMRNVAMANTHKTPKISLYSGHDTNVVSVLQALGVYIPHVPAYSSAIMSEFYEQNSQYFIKFLYYRGIPPTVSTLRVPGCEILCPFGKFLHLMKNVIPSKNELWCDLRG